jgi:hypothetical protein
MDWERVKQLEMEYSERSNVFIKDLERLKKAMIDEKVIPEQHKDTQPDYEAYIQMPRQQRRAYQRRLEKEMRRNNINH